MVTLAPPRVTSEPEIIQSPQDFAGLAEMRSLAFADKQPRCRALQEHTTKSSVKYYKTLAEKYPDKLTRCAVVRDPETGTILGACQLQWGNEPGDLSMPSALRHKIKEGECYLEWIGVSPQAQGRGVGSKLLAWADRHARTLGARVLSLEVMSTNPARNLYERKGWVVTKGVDEDPLGLCIAACLIYCCMGCRYYRALYMEKPLQ